jgi:N-acetylglutamate synthase-like GNAT family acetyltransferase
MWFDKYLDGAIGYEYFDAEGQVGLIDWDDRPHATITDLEAITSGAGFGTMLVKKAIAKAREIGVKEVRAQAEPTPQARGFWNSMSRLGFEEVGEDTFALKLESDDDA